jgi:DNA-binding NarL/FixJ family response regulator
MGTLCADNGPGHEGCGYLEHDVSRVLLYSSHPLVIRGIRGMLTDAPGIDLIGHAANWVETMLKIHESAPSIVIINDDGNVTGSANIIETVSSVIAEFPRLNCLMIMNVPDDEKELAALKRGVKGVLIENSESDMLLECIKCISNGGLWFRRAVLEKFVNEQLFLHRLNGNCRQEFTLPRFTSRELEIIQMAGKGIKNREIGRSLFISEKTVKHHLSKIFKKLRIRKRVDLRMYL